MQREHILDDYAQVAPRLAAFGEDLCQRLDSWLCTSSELKVHSLGRRVKAAPSLADKLARPDKTYGHLWDVTDLLGLRVITYFDDEVDLIGRLIESRLQVDFQHSVDKRQHRDQRDPSRFGYRSLHYVCHLPADFRQADSPPPRFEIQIRTLLEHAWAEIEHDLGYKSRDTMPAPVRRRLHRLAGLLELADQEFVAIRTELSDYAAKLPARLASAESVPLDRLSLEGLLDLPECATLDSRIADHLGKPLGTTFYPDYLLRLLGLAGFTTVSDVRRALDLHGAVALAMVDPYFVFAARAWNLAPAALRGYSLFFVAHARVLASDRRDESSLPGLTLDKVMRLARLYRELDYPHDEREAQRVASLLYDTFHAAGALT